MRGPAQVWLLVYALATALGLASQSLQSVSGLSESWPGSATFRCRLLWRAELRIHNFTFNNAYQTIGGTNAFAVRLGPSNAVVLTSWPDQSLACSLALSSGADVVVRFQRDAAKLRADRGIVECHRRQRFINKPPAP